MFDSHAHLTDEKFKDDRKEVISRAVDAGMTGILTIHSPLEDRENFKELIDNYEFIYGAVGVHPGDKPDKEAVNSINDMLQDKKIVAVGEIGLDYHYKDNPPGDIQIKMLQAQLQLARENNLPVIIHCRDAWEDMIKILCREKVCRGVMHCFSGEEEMMKKCLDMGLYISIAAPVTFPNAEKTRRIAEVVPLEKLLVETDCPYLSPQAMRGKRNEPAYLKYTIEKIAEIKKTSVSEIINITTRNTKNLFRI
jgi:TatD DNase family protein